MTIREFTEAEARAKAAEKQVKWMKSEGLKSVQAPDIPEEYQDVHPYNTPTEIKHYNSEYRNNRAISTLAKIVSFLVRWTQ